jgi:hypothetical protein
MRIVFAYVNGVLFARCNKANENNFIGLIYSVIQDYFLLGTLRFEQHL